MKLSPQSLTKKFGDLMFIKVVLLKM